jgi:hypothetical protein
MMTAQPAKSSSASSSARNVSTSRSLVGSSSSSRLAPRAQHLAKMHAVALAARQRADLLLLVGALEVERGAVGARVHFLLAEKDHVVAFGNFLPDGFLAIEAVARLVDITETNDSPILIVPLSGFSCP